MKTTIPPALIGVMLALPIATGLTLPASGPLPKVRPDIVAKAGDAENRAPAAEQPASPDETGKEAVPTPMKKPALPDSPAVADGNRTQAETENTKPPEDPKVEKPDDGEAKAEGKDEGKTSDETETKPAVEVEPPAVSDPPPNPEDPKALAACLADLKSIGAVFEIVPTVDGDTGCGMAAPITLSKVLPDVDLKPEATLRCETALQLARMTRDMLKPAAQAAFPEKQALTGILQASSYVCRKRNSAATGKLSEHAQGNAIDIAALRFGKEEEPVMIAKQNDGTAKAAFQRAFNAFACLYFTTVLSPGSDATHQDHMHLDVIQRKSGSRYCR